MAWVHLKKEKEEKQLEKVKEAKSRFQEAERERERKARVAVGTVGGRALLDFANSQKIKDALKQIWDYQFASPVKVTVRGFWGKDEEKLIPQVPFKVLVEFQSPSYEGQFRVEVGFEYLYSSRSGPEKSQFPHPDRLYLENSAKGIVVIYVESHGEYPSREYAFSSLEEFLDYYARSVARL